MSGGTSVVIPCFNGEKYLAEALESIRSQSVPVREILVVDDGSDVPLQPPPSWAGPPLRVFRTANRGQAAARNFGTARATGEFVAFLDADDFWHARKVELQESALRANAGAVACYTRCVEGPGFFGFGPYPPLDVSDEEFLLVLWYNNFFPPSSVMVRRSALEQVGGFREQLQGPEDIELWLRLLRRGRFVQIPEPLCFYRVHHSQFTSDPSTKMMHTKRARSFMIAENADRLVAAGLRGDKLWDAHRNDILLVFYRRQFGAARALLFDYWKDHPLDTGVLLRALVSLLPSALVTRLRGRVEMPAARSGEDSRPRADWAQLYERIRPVLSRNT